MNAKKFIAISLALLTLPVVAQFKVLKGSLGTRSALAEQQPPKQQNSRNTRDATVQGQMKEQKTAVAISNFTPAVDSRRIEFMPDAGSYQVTLNEGTGKAYVTNYKVKLAGDNVGKRGGCYTGEFTCHYDDREGGKKTTLKIKFDKEAEYSFSATYSPQGRVVGSNATLSVKGRDGFTVSDDQGLFRFLDSVAQAIEGRALDAFAGIPPHVRKVKPQVPSPSNRGLRSLLQL